MQIEYMVTKIEEFDSIDVIPTDAEVLSVNGRPFIARCESCRKPILDGDSSRSIPADSFYCDGEGTYLCVDCASEMMHEDERRVTHEMALDAGDPSLEGQPF